MAQMRETVDNTKKRNMASRLIKSDMEENLWATGASSTMCPTCQSENAQTTCSAPDRFHLRTEVYQLTRCSSCECVWLVNPPKPEEMGHHYTKEYHRGIAAAGEGAAQSRWKKQVRTIKQYKTSGSILDVGCSTGGFLGCMKDDSWQLYGIELERSTAAKATAATGAKVFVGDVLEAPFLSGTFDVVTAFDLLEHVYSPRQVVGKVWQWLKPGGIFYAIMPNIASWEFRVFGSYWYGLELPRHLTHFSPQSLRQLMKTNGFEEVLVRTPPVSYMERSVGYLWAESIHKFGFTAVPQAMPRKRSVLFRLLRKAVRLGIFTPFAQLGSLTGQGPSIEVAFRKPIVRSVL